MRDVGWCDDVARRLVHCSQLVRSRVSSKPTKCNEYKLIYYPGVGGAVASCLVRWTLDLIGLCSSRSQATVL